MIMATIYWVFVIWKGGLALWACHLCSPQPPVQPTGTCPWFILCCHYLAILKFLNNFPFWLGPTDHEAGSTERHCMQCFSNILPLNPLNDSVKESFLLFSFYSKENWGLVSLSNLVKGPIAYYWQTRISIQVCLPSKPKFLLTISYEGVKQKEESEVGKRCWAQKLLMFNWGGGASH